MKKNEKPTGKKNEKPKEKKTYAYKRVTFYYNGKRYEATGKTLNEAHAKAAKKKLALENGEIGLSSDMTVARWAAEWLETYKANVVGEAHYYRLSHMITGVIVPAIGTLKLKQVKDVHLQKILNSRAGYSKSDLSKLRIIMRSMFRRARISRLIPYDPAEDLVLPAAKEGTHRSITDYEREKILALAETHYAGLWIKTMLYCGPRPGETRALDWRHVDFENKVIHVEQAMKAGTTRIGDPKSAAGVRDIPIPDELYAALKAAPHDNPFEPVFKQLSTGKRHSQDSMQGMWESFKRELDISMGAKVYRNKITVSAVATDLVPYCLRHTYCTDLETAGVPINVARYLMGHANIAMTSKIYTHTTIKTLKDAAAKINTHHKKAPKDAADKINQNP